MHELGIAEAVLDAIHKESARYPGVRPTRVGLRIGELAGVDASALRFAFEAIVAGTDLEALCLEIEICPRKQQCMNCEEQFVVEYYNLQCPHCHDSRSKCMSGDELDLAFVEVEEYAAG